MKSGTLPKDIPRLIEEDDDVGELLRAAERDFTRGLDEPHAFRQLERRRLNLRHALATFLGTLAQWVSGRPVGTSGQR